jgi:hypothetical protein
MTSQSRLEVVEAFTAANAMLLFALARHLYPAYYQDPRVLAAIGEPPRPPFPDGFEVEPTAPDLLEKLLARRRAAPTA